MGGPELRERINERIQAADNAARWPETGKEGLLKWPAWIESSRRAKLLARNRFFLEELEQIQREEEQECLDLGHALTKSICLTKKQREYHLVPDPDLTEGLVEDSVYREIEAPWQDFCYRWGINDGWDGHIETLEHYAYGDAAIFVRDQNGKSSSFVLAPEQPAQETLEIGGFVLDPKRTDRWAAQVVAESVFAYLKITPTLQSEGLWPLIEAIKKHVWGTSPREARTFERDLCWWDLHSSAFGKRSYAQIALDWRRIHPDQKVFRNTVQNAVRRIHHYIDRLNPPNCIP